MTRSSLNRSPEKIFMTLCRLKLPMWLNDKNIIFELSKEAYELLIEKGFDPIYGARPLKRTIQRLLEDPMAEEMIAGTFKEGDKIRVERKDDTLVFEHSSAARSIAEK